MKEPLVSIIISAYNHENFILPCLESIMNQTYSNIELLIYNDGSKDNTHTNIQMKLEELQQRFVRVEYVNKENEGISRNFNLGIKSANGEYIKTFASDDLLLPNAIKLLVDSLEKNRDYDIAYGDGYHVYSDSPEITSEHLEEKYRFSNLQKYESGNIHRFLFKMLPKMSTWTVLFRKKCFEESGYYDEDLLCEDMDLYLRFSKKYKFLYLKDVLAIHRIHGNNAGLMPSVMLPSMEKMLKKYDETHFFENETYRNDFLKLILFTERALIEVNYENLKIYNKKVIAWGTGNYYKNNKKNIPWKIDYFIDSDEVKHYQKMDGKKIYPIQKILEEDKESIFVLMMSGAVIEISDWLDARGFVVKKNYY